MQNEVSSLIPVTESSPSPQYSCFADFLGMMLWAVQKLGVAKEKRGEIGCPFPERKEKRRKEKIKKELLLEQGTISVKKKSGNSRNKSKAVLTRDIHIPEISFFFWFFFLLWIKRAKKEVSLPGFEGEWAAPLKDQIKLIKANELCEPGSCC